MLVSTIFLSYLFSKIFFFRVDIVWLKSKYGYMSPSNEIVQERIFETRLSVHLSLFLRVRSSAYTILQSLLLINFSSNLTESN